MLRSLCASTLVLCLLSAPCFAAQARQARQSTDNSMSVTNTAQVIYQNSTKTAHRITIHNLGPGAITVSAGSGTAPDTSTNDVTLAQGDTTVLVRSNGFVNVVLSTGSAAVATYTVENSRQ